MISIGAHHPNDLTGFSPRVEKKLIKISCIRYCMPLRATGVPAAGDVE